MTLPRRLVALVALGALNLPFAALAAPPPAEAEGAPVTIIEFTDFECPFCARVQPTLSGLIDRYGARVAFEVRHLPLAFHDRAEPAARAAIAAEAQGEGRRMRQILFERHKELADADLLNYARVLGLDLLRFGVDLGSPETQAIVDRDRAIAAAVGARGTPNFFINGKQLRGAQPLEAFAEIIDGELAALEADPDAPRGAAFARRRTQLSNPDLYRFIYLGETPPEPQASAPSAPSSPPVDDTVWKVTIAPDDAVRGEAAAPVTLVVFSNYQCPFSARLAPVVEALAAKYGDALRLVMKHRPLPFHDRATPAAIAGVCAQRQQRFWGFHERAIGSQRALADDDLLRYAVEAGAERDAFERCLDDPSARDRVAEDEALAGRVGALGTPVSFVNGRRIRGAQPQSVFEAAIDLELIRAQAAAGASAVSYDALIAEGEEIKPLADERHVFDLAGRLRVGRRPARDAVPIVVFTDYECPFSQRLWRTFLAEVEQELGRAVSLHVKHFPLPHHRLAEPRARAVACAEEQGRGRALHDRLVAAPPEPEPTALDEPAEADDRVGPRGMGDEGGLGGGPAGPSGEGAGVEPPPEPVDPIAAIRASAKEARLDLTRFDACLAADRHDELIAADVAEARAAGVRGTPTVFVDGRLYKPSGAYRVEALRRVLDELAAEKRRAKKQQR